MSGGTSDPRATSPGGHLTRGGRWHSDTGSKELNYAAGLAIDEANKLIYIVDCGNKRVQIVSFEGDFIR